MVGTIINYAKMVDTVGKTLQVLMNFKALKYHHFRNPLITKKVSSNSRLPFESPTKGLVILNL